LIDSIWYAATSVTDVDGDSGKYDDRRENGKSNHDYHNKYCPDYRAFQINVLGDADSIIILRPPVIIVIVWTYLLGTGHNP
jgi:hypothetical protein